MSGPFRLIAKPTVADEVRKSAVDILNKMLAEAESGQITTLVVIVGRPDGTWGDYFSGSENCSTLIGRLEIMKHELIAKYLAEQ